MTRRKRLLCAFLALIMCIGILPITSMASDFEDGLDHFAKTAAFTESIFSDVQKEDWFYDNVKSVYEYELMRGKGENRFDPSNSVTLAETITIAARIHAQYYIGMDVFNNSDPWYQAYVDYAVDCGIISDLLDEDYDAPATRGAFAAIISRALPDSAFEEINIVAYNGIPDVALSDSYGRAVYKLYRAGIMVGNDENGTFAPDSNIKRCEVAAIVTRMVEPALRQSVRLGEEYTVSFDLGYQGMTLDAQKVVAGYTAAEPKAPTRQNYIFEGWYTAANGGVRFEFDTEIHADMTLFAHWKVDPVWWTWIMDEFFDKDKEKPDEPEKPDKPDEPREEYDYGKLPYRPGKTWEELVEINGGEEPYIEMNDNDQVGLYIGRISDNRVEDVYDVIAELNNVRELLNINDARFEFVPSYDDGRIDDQSYRVQQVYNGVQVWCAQIVVIVDDDGYINGFISDYVDYVRYSGIEIEHIISAEQAKQIVMNIINTDNINEIQHYSSALTIVPNIDIAWYGSFNDKSESYSYVINANNGSLLYIGKIEDQNASIFENTNTKSYDEDSIKCTYSDAFEDATTNLYNESIKISKTTTKDKKTEYILLDRSYYNKQYPTKNNERNWGIAVYNSIDDSGNPIDSFDDKLYPCELIKSPKNEWDVEWNPVHLRGLYALYNINRVMGQYTSVGFDIDMPIEINIGIRKRNAAYSHFNSVNSAIEFKFGYLGSSELFDSIRMLDTVGHEFTHLVQDKYVNPVKENFWCGASLGDGFLEAKQNSGNIDWVESKAISEGTADIMGMLIEALCEGIDIHEKESSFWLYGENDSRYNEVTRKYLNNEYNGHYTVQQMKDFYRGTDFVYQDKRTGCKNGVGYNETPILIGILRFIIENPINSKDRITSKELFELWFTTITMLNAKSEFDHLRFALELAAKKLNMDDYIDTIIDACESVGITYDRQDNVYSAWFFKGLAKAYNNGIISENTANNDAAKILTRREYLDLLAKMCEKVGVNTGSDIVAWAKGLQVIGDKWSGKKLDESIPKWEAALLMYHIFNEYHEEFKAHGWKEVCGYEFVSESRIDHWKLFRYAFNGDLNSDTSMTGINIVEMIQYYKGCAKYDEDTDGNKVLSNKLTLESFQRQNMVSKYSPITYVTGKSDTDTIYAVYCTGFYQLWRNGMFKGYSSSGKLRLGATDSISLGEACALITQVIPD